MPANKNALIRFKTIDNCLSNRYRRWTLDDLVEACSDALYEMEGITKGVSVRTVQSDLQIMRSDKLGYNAPIEVYDHKYYRYSDPDYSIMNMPMSKNEYELLHEAVDMLSELGDFDHFAQISDMVGRLRDVLSRNNGHAKPIIHFDSVPGLRGLHMLNPLYNHIAKRHTLCVAYQSFKSPKPMEITLYPHLLKEFRNRWFLYGTDVKSGKLYDLPLDRIKDIAISDIPYKDNPDFDSEHFFDDLIGVSKNLGDKPSVVKFWADASQSQYIITKPIHRSQKLVEQDASDGSCIFEIEVILNMEFYSVFMSYGPGVKILSPRNAKKFMKSRIAAIANLYAD